MYINNNVCAYVRACLCLYKPVYNYVNNTRVKGSRIG